MEFRPPAGIDDLADRPDLKAELQALWNADGAGGYMGRYVTDAAGDSPNYVDPRVEAPVGEPAKVPWNGFPRVLSRWYDDEQSTEAREGAEATADILTPILYWVQPVDGALRLLQAEEHRLPFFAERFGQHVLHLARPLREMLPDGTVGAEIPRLRRQQDEYLEWHASRDAQGRIESIAFTAEPPDYWRALAQVAPDRVVELYRQLVSPDVAKSDLFFESDVAAFGIDGSGQAQWFLVPGMKDSYNELNAWTTTKGIVHLTHRANTLGAEVRLASDASHVWGSDGDSAGPFVPEIARIACGGYGGINRSSDPLIGHGVGRAVAGGARVTLSDPIGLYVATVDVAGLRGPQGQPIGSQARHVLRGDDDPFDPRILRFAIRLPDGAGFALEDCTLDGRPLRRGGQVARKTTVHLYANVYRDGGDATSRACTGQVCRHAQRTELFSAAAIGATCPAADHPVWLIETPFEGAADVARAALAAAVAAPEAVNVAAAVDPGRRLATSRAVAGI